MSDATVDRSGEGLIASLMAARVIDLSQTMHPGMPQLPGMPRYSVALLRRHGDSVRTGGYSSAHDVIATISHSGTHIDAIGHVSVDGRLYDDLPAGEVQTGTRGLGQLGIETVAPIIRRGVLLDIAGLLGVPALEPAFGVDASLLERAAAAAEVEVRPGDVVLVRTGWGRFWDEPDRYVSADRGLPGVDGDGAAWIAARRAFATGADVLMYERHAPADDRMPVHSTLIKGAGIHLIENMNLEGLVEADVHEFAFVALPLRVIGATGSQIRPIALA